MECIECHERLYAFLDHELTDAERAEISKHLGDCHGCDDRATFERRFLEHLRDCATSEQAPAELRSRIVARLHAAGLPPS